MLDNCNPSFTFVMVYHQTHNQNVVSEQKFFRKCPTVVSDHSLASSSVIAVEARVQQEVKRNVTAVRQDFTLRKLDLSADLSVGSVTVVVPLQFCYYDSAWLQGQG